MLQLGRYDQALHAADAAEALYESLLTGTFDAAQALYVRAAVLFKMRHFSDALRTLGRARALLADFGDSVPLAKTVMLEAGILFDQGNIAAAQEHWRRLLPTLDRLGTHVEHARALANLGECNLRLGNLDQAEQDAGMAIERYRKLGMDTEAIRSTWTLGKVALARGDIDASLQILARASAGFADRAMHMDAGFVQLDRCEALLRVEAWKEAEEVARRLVGLFSAAGVTLAAVEALTALRSAVQNREATADMIDLVRATLTTPPPDAAAVEQPR